MVLTKTAVIYSNSSQECERMAELLKKIEGVEDFHRYELGKDFEDYQNTFVYWREYLDDNHWL